MVKGDQIELDSGDDAQRGLSAPQSPEQVLVLGGRDSEDLARPGDHLQCPHLVRTHAERTRDRTDAPTGEQSDGADLGCGPAHRRQSVGCGGVDELTPAHPGAERDPLAAGVHGAIGHRPGVDQQHRRVDGNGAMSGGAHRDPEPVGPGIADRCSHVLG